jgi:hypothetical protein
MRTVLLTVLLAGAVAASALSDDGDFQWQGQLASGQLLDIRGVLGPIHAEGTSEGTASVTAHKTANVSDPLAVTIQVVPFDGGVVICAMYPNSNKPNLCNPPGMDSYLSADNGNDVQVEFTVKVPMGVRLAASTLRGDIQATALTADVNASTLVGGITLSTAGGAQATTLEGSISASIGSATWSGARFFDTLEGNVDLTIPADANVLVRASTLHGTVMSDFPLTIRTTPFGFSTASGTLGTDGRSLRLSTDNGNITLRQGPASGQ